MCVEFFVPESPIRTPERVDLGAACACSRRGWWPFLLGVSEGPVWGWGSAKVLGFIALAVHAQAMVFAISQKGSMLLVQLPSAATKEVSAAKFTLCMRRAGLWASGT